MCLLIVCEPVTHQPTDSSSRKYHHLATLVKQTMITAVTWQHGSKNHRKSNIPLPFTPMPPKWKQNRRKKKILYKQHQLLALSWFFTYLFVAYSYSEIGTIWLCAFHQKFIFPVLLWVIWSSPGVVSWLHVVVVVVDSTHDVEPEQSK